VLLDVPRWLTTVANSDPTDPRWRRRHGLDNRQHIPLKIVWHAVIQIVAVIQPRSNDATSGSLCIVQHHDKSSGAVARTVEENCLMCCIVLPVVVRCTTFWEWFIGSWQRPTTDCRLLQSMWTTIWCRRLTALLRWAEVGGTLDVHSSRRILPVRPGSAGQTTTGTLWRRVAWWSSSSSEDEELWLTTILRIFVQCNSLGYPLCYCYY